jgi:hypothetical protein
MMDASAPIVALSVSNGPDLARFGHLERHMRQVLSELLVGLLRAGFRVGYGGDLRRDGYTRELFEAVSAAYDRNQLRPAGRPAIVHYFALSSWQSAKNDELLQHLRTLGKVAETRFVDAAGDYDAVFGTYEGLRKVSSDGETAGVTESDLIAKLARRREASQGAGPSASLTAMRQTMAKETILRVLASGKVAGYSGRMPGIVEEALLHAEAGRLLIPLGAFGGAARDVAITLGLLPEDDRVRYAETGEDYYSSLEELRELAERHAELLERAGVGSALRVLVMTDEPTAIAAGVVRLAHLAARETEGRRPIM